jgi:hypothetical protein
VCLTLQADAQYLHTRQTQTGALERSMLRELKPCAGVTYINGRKNAACVLDYLSQAHKLSTSAISFHKQHRRTSACNPADANLELAATNCVQKNAACLSFYLWAMKAHKQSDFCSGFLLTKVADNFLEQCLEQDMQHNCLQTLLQSLLSFNFQMLVVVTHWKNHCLRYIGL